MRNLVVRLKLHLSYTTPFLVHQSQRKSGGFQLYKRIKNVQMALVKCANFFQKHPFLHRLAHKWCTEGQYSVNLTIHNITFTQEKRSIEKGRYHYSICLEKRILIISKA